MSPIVPGDVQWFPAEIRRLINAIKRRPSIYNQRHENFGTREAQIKIWKLVADDVGGGKTDIQCRDKWNCLRGTYRRHVRTEATNTVKRRSGWPWVEMMGFMKDFVLDKEELDALIATNPKLQAAQFAQQQPAKTTQVESRTGETKKHSSNCPKSSIYTKEQCVTAKSTPKNLTAVSITGAKGTTITTPTSGLTFAGGIYSNGILYKCGSIGLVPPSQANVGLGILQTNQQNIGVRLVQPNKPNVFIGSMQQNQSNVQMSLVQSNQPNLGLKIVQSNQGSVGVAVVQPSKTNASTIQAEGPTSAKKQKISVETTNQTSVDPIEVDLSKVKRDPDEPSSPFNPEFVDIDSMVKKEPIDTEELDLSVDFNFLPEDAIQDSSQDSSRSNQEQVSKNSEKEPTAKFSTGQALPNSGLGNRSSPNLSREPEDSSNDPNQLFMCSVVANMKQLSPYDQSVFKLKVQQILHEMMFPKK